MSKQAASGQPTLHEILAAMLLASSRLSLVSLPRDTVPRANTTVLESCADTRFDQGPAPDVYLAFGPGRQVGERHQEEAGAGRCGRSGAGERKSPPRHPQQPPAPPIVPMVVDPVPQANAFGPANPPALMQLSGNARPELNDQPPNKRGRKGAGDTVNGPLSK